MRLRPNGAFKIKIMTDVTHVHLIDLFLQIPRRYCAFRAQVAVRDVSRSRISMVLVVVSETIAMMMMILSMIMPPIATRRRTSTISSVMSVCMQIGFFHGRLCISLLTFLF